MLARERAAESQGSGRVCDRSELKACSQTGLHLLPDELAKSDVSGVIADRRLVRRCCESGKAGLK